MTYRLTEVPVRGGVMTVGEWGADQPDAPVVLAIHGITASHRAWQSVAAALPEARVIAPDLRGRGRSRDLPGPWGMEQHAEDMLAVLMALDVTDCTVVGHSMGAFVAVATVAARWWPTALVLVDGGLTLATPAGWTPADAQRALGPAAERLAMTFPSREAYREYWQRHPAFVGEWSDVIADYVDYDLMGEEPQLRSRAVADAMLQDSVELYGTEVIDRALAGRQEPVTLLTAPRGLQNETPGLYPPPVVAAWAERLAWLRPIEVPDTNHYSILMSPRGAGVVAYHLRAAIRVEAES